MKTKFRITALVLSLICVSVLLAGSACKVGGNGDKGIKALSKEEAYDIYISALENVREQDFRFKSVISQVADNDIEGYGKVSSTSEQEVTAETVRYLADDMVLRVVSTVKNVAMGSTQSTSNEVIINSDKIFVKNDGDTSFTVISRADASASYVNELLTLGDATLTKDIFENAVLVSNGDGSKSIKVHINTEQYLKVCKEQIDTLIEGLGASGLTVDSAEMDVEFRFDSKNRPLVVKSDGIVKISGTYMGVKLETTSTFKSDVDYYDYGNVTIPIPD